MDHADKQAAVFLHLSDIHFQVSEHAAIYDLDGDLRSMLINDALKCAQKFGAPDGILITGDIAFGAKEDEYKKAHKWLVSLCDAVGCDISRVWCVPGNHDIDRGEISRRRILQNTRQDLRNCSLTDVSRRIAGYLPDEYVFYDPLKKYNQFAAEFGCQVTANEPRWDDSFAIGDGKHLRIFGLNSVLVSDANDGTDNGRGNLVLGEYQCILPHDEDKGIYNGILCQHPPNWLRDGFQAEQKFNARARVQLFGHEHVDRLGPAGKSVRIAAGAVHPNRGSSWDPRYNWIVVSSDSDNVDMPIKVEVMSRQWDETKQKFVGFCDGADQESFCKRSLSTAANSTIASSSEVCIVACPDDCEIDKSVAAATGSPKPGAKLQDKSRVLVQRFFSLTYIQQMKAATKLDLHEEGDQDIEGVKLRLEFLKRAKTKGDISKLWDVVESLHRDGKYPDNPYADE